jgi:hypothetical protein
MNNYYTYAYLREDKTPYYIGKGEKDRIYKKGKGEIKPPRDKSRIIFLKQNLIENDAFKHEKYMIALFGRKDLGTGILHNRTDGGDGISGYKHTPETKKSLSDMKTGRKRKPHSEETKRKISQANKGRIVSEETRKKLSEMQKGKTLSEETKNKISKIHKGKIVSDETKKKMGKSKLNNKYAKK